jgi:hypothetical protein
MKFIGINEKTYNKDVTASNYPMPENASKGHKLLEKQLKLLFNCPMLHEYPCWTTGLRMDIFLPSLKLAFEYDGTQHTEYVDFFHKSRDGFGKAQANDITKDMWCDKNDIILIRINKGNIKNLQDIIYERTRGDS